MCSEECWAKAWATSRQARFCHTTPNSSHFKTYELFSSEVFHVRLSVLPHVAADNWNRRKRNVDKGTTASASLVTEPLPRCAAASGLSAPSQTGSSRVVCDLFSLICWSFCSVVCLFPLTTGSSGSCLGFSQQGWLLWRLKQILEICTAHLSLIDSKWHSTFTVPSTVKPKVNMQGLTSRPSQTEGQQVHTGKCRKVW